MRNLILSCALLLAACGGNSNAPASDPSTTNATPASTAGTTTTTTETTTTADPAKPGDGKCGVTTTSSATALDACMADCEKLSDKAPEGSRCMPPRVECKQGCKVKFEKK